MPNIPTYTSQVPRRDPPDIEQDLKTGALMFGGNGVKAPDAWGGDFEKMSDAAASFAQPTAADVLYGGKSKEPKPADAFVSDRDWDYVATVRDDYDSARRASNPAKFREALTRVGGTLRSYPHLEPHLPEGATKAYRDYRRSIDDDERQNFTAKGLSSTAYDRDRMAQAAAARILGGLVHAAQGGALDTNNANSRIQVNATAKSPQQGRPGTDAQPATPAPQHKSRTLVSPYSEKELVRDADKGWLAGPADPGSRECVAFVKYAVPELGRVSAQYGWKEGRKITGYEEVALEPGTPIATFVDGRYPSKRGESHAAIFLRYGVDEKTKERGMLVLDQHNERGLGTTFLPFNPHSKFTSNAYNYSVIEK